MRNILILCPQTGVAIYIGTRLNAQLFRMFYCFRSRWAAAHRCLQTAKHMKNPRFEVEDFAIGLFAA